MRTEIRDDVSELGIDVKEIKENTLTKADFYRTQSANEQKMDKMYDILLEIRKGGNDNGR